MPNKVNQIAEAIKLVFNSLAEAYMERSSPDGGTEECEVQAYVHIRSMQLADIMEWHEHITENECGVFYDADSDTFYITGDTEDGDYNEYEY